MKQAPVSVRIVAAIYAAMPALLLWLAQAELPSPSVLVPNALLFAAAPVVAFGVWRVRRWAFFALGVHAFFLAGLLAVDAYFYTGLGWPMLTAILLWVVLLLRLWPADIRAPYTAKDGRGFRLSPRHEINLQAEIEIEAHKISGKTFDISQGGAYIECDTQGLVPGTRCFLQLHMRQRELRCQARIVSVNPEGLGTKPAGVGLQFSNLKDSDAKTIDNFMALGRKYPRSELALAIELSADRRFLRTETVNVSLGGCFVKEGVGIFQPGDSVMVKLVLDAGDEIDCVAEVAWLADGEHSAAGLALQFSNLARADHRRLRERLENQ